MAKQIHEDIRNLGFKEVAIPLTSNEHIRHMLGFIQHGNIAAYAHCVRVADGAPC